MSLTTPPRAVKNFNPGNLRKGIEWQGLSMLRTDPDFCVFVDATEGFRALAIDLHTKWKYDGLTTLYGIISKFAPQNENPTGAYIKAVSEMMGLEPTTWLHLDNPDQLTSLCRAISVFEAGGWFFSVNDLNEGVALAFASFRQPDPVA
jgi:hypothetical protein